MDLNQINFEKKSAEIFGRIADEAAYKIKLEIRNNETKKKSKNKNSQIRKFYDELVMWNDKVQQEREQRQQKFEELLPFIKMLKAKVAYAKGRGHIDQDFQEIFDCCIDQINSPNSLKDVKLFMEAVMGYSKAYE